MEGIWIRSQDKTTLVNASRIYVLPFHDSGTTVYRLTNEVLFQDQVDFDVLGVYTTQERALQVLDDIQQFIINYHTMFLPVFQMPVE